MATRWYRDATEEEAELGLRLPNLLKFPVRAMAVSVVPWCDRHDAEMVNGHPKSQCWMAEWAGDGGACRREEPPRHYVKEQHD